MLNHFMTFVYLDPGTGSMALQALLGGSAGIIVFLLYLWNSGSRSSHQGKFDAGKIGGEPRIGSSQTSPAHIASDGIPNDIGAVPQCVCVDPEGDNTSQTA